nr:hypothetical protein [Tanacetum cinerariifolium]
MVESKITHTSDPKEAVCFYCNTKGHWMRSYPKYLKDLKDRKVEKGGHSGMYMIELHNTTTSDSWVLDTGCGTHICVVLQGLKESRRLKHGELNLVMENRKIIPVTRIGKYELMLKSEHSHLGHVNKKRIAQLQKDEVLESFDFKSDDVCESCLLGKMTKSPFTGTCERGEGLLDLVHTNVCGPFRSATKDGKHYYVTFTDDFSKYGYVSLIKHKSDTFEVFKTYQNEVENHLGSKIKLTPPRTPQLNGVVDTRNRTLPKDNVVFVARRGVFLTREMISKEDSRSKIDLEEIQKSADEEPIVNTDTQQEVDKISDSTLTGLNEPTNYKEAMVSPEAAKWKEAMKSEIQSMYDNQV